MPEQQQIIFEELEEKERILLLRAFDYDVDEKGYILDTSGEKIASKESPSKFLHIKTAALMPGSLEIIDGTPTCISEFIRERVESKNAGRD